MKTTLSCFFISFCCFSSVIAQNWPAGNWLYTATDSNQIIQYQSSYLALDEVAILGRTATLIDWGLQGGSDSFLINRQFYTYQAGDSLFVHGLEEGDTTFHLWMIFGGEVGDTITLQAPVSNEQNVLEYRLRIDSISLLEVDHSSVSFVSIYHYSPLDGYSFIPGNQIIPDTGSPIALLDWPETADLIDKGLVCRWAGDGNQPSFFVSMVFSWACYSIVPNETESELSKALLIFPNPANDFLHFQADFPVAGIPFRILSKLGQPLKAGTLQSGLPIPISELPSGAYLLELKIKEEFGYWRFMKL